MKQKLTYFFSMLLLCIIGTGGALAETVTATWDFRSTADPRVEGSINGTSGTLDSDVDGIVMTVDASASGAKLDSQNRTGDAQVNNGTIIKIPVVSTNDVVTIVSYPGYYNYTVGGEAATANETVHTATSDEVSQGYVEIVATNTSYLYYITVVQDKDAGGSESGSDDSFSVKWVLSNGEESESTASPADSFLKVAWGYGSLLSVEGTKKLDDGKTYTLFQRVGDDKLENKRNKIDNSYVEFVYKPYAGLTLTPTTLDFDMFKVGTGDPNIWVEIIQGATTTSIAENVAIRKTGEAEPSEHLSYDLTKNAGIVASGDEVTVRIYVGKLANNKQVGIANLAVSGTLEGTIKTYTTVYNLAEAIAAYNEANNKNIQGFEDVLPPTTADADANAFDLKVDATNGKLGPNGDWAQITEGTVLTLMGVPQGATVTFVLYKDAQTKTGLTIKGTEYTEGQTYTSTKDQNLVMKCTNGGYIKTITVEGTAFVDVLDSDGYTNTWYFGKSNGAEAFSLEKSAEYTYTVDGRSLVINTSSGKLNNASREDTDQWAQCNDGTLFKVPVYEGSKLTWGKYNSGSETGFTVDGQLYNEYYVASEEGTVELTAKGISYLSNIKIAPEELLDITGTVTGGSVDGARVLLTAANGQVYEATIDAGAYSAKVPADTYTVDLSDDVAYVVNTPSSVNISDAGSVNITIIEASPQTLSGAITNAPAEAFTLTFTGNSHSKQVECDANATSYTVVLDPDTYTISSSVGALSNLSKAGIKLLKEAATHNIYFPEEIPAATQQEITVDNTATVAANVYNSVRDALAAAKAGNISAPIITLTSGQTYREQVKVDMADVTLKTSGTEKATITNYYGIGYCYYSLAADGYYDRDRAMTRNSLLKVHPARWGATVLVTKNGNNFRAENIIFENSFNQYYTDEEVADGVLAYPMGDTTITYDRTKRSGDSGYADADAKSVTERAAAIGFENGPTGCELYDCTFIGSQDTYYTSGSVYAKNCVIQGNTDYIFGGGHAVFDNCNLVIGGYSDATNSAYITAQKGDSGDAYIFRDCTVTSAGRAYTLANLGRDWGGAAATVYYFNLQNEIGNKLEYKWNNMGGGVNAGTANLHIYDFDATVNANYNTTGSTGANINGLLDDETALGLYADVVTFLSFTPEHIYDDNVVLGDNTAYNVCRIAASDNVERTVELTRAISADKWSTIVLPFAMTGAQLKAAFGDDVKVATLDENSTDNNLSFATVNATEANKPYAIRVSSAFASATIDGVTIADATPAQTGVGGSWNFVGTYVDDTMEAGSFYFKNNGLSKAGVTGTHSIKPFRAYFKYAGSGETPNSLSYTFDDVPTAVENISEVATQGAETVFTISGQRVSQPVKGVNIVNGKKVIK